MLKSSVGQPLVNFVTDDPQTESEGQACQTLYLIPCPGSSSRIAWRVKDDRLGSVGDGILDITQVWDKTLIQSGFHHYWDAACKLNLVSISHPVRSKKDDFITGINDGKEGIDDGVFGATGDDYLIR